MYKTINISAGHTLPQSKAPGATGLAGLRESVENRVVLNKLILLLRRDGINVNNCTCDFAKSSLDCLNNAVRLHNAFNADFDLQLHFNAGANKPVSDGKTTGVEAYVYNASSEIAHLANRMCECIAGIGYTNRGVKTTPKYKFITATEKPAILLECCFIDDIDDINLYSADKIATAIYAAITDHFPVDTSTITIYDVSDVIKDEIVSALRPLDAKYDLKISIE